MIFKKKSVDRFLALHPTPDPDGLLLLALFYLFNTFTVFLLIWRSSVPPSTLRCAMPW
jgi:hypothetical protein